MSTINPRSYPQILGRMVDTVSGRLGVDLRAGDPSLSVLEAAAHSDLRSSVDLLQMLAMVDLSRARGDALDRIGQSEGVARPQASAAYGTVTVTDSRYTRQETKIYQGFGGLVAGVTVIYVEDGSFLTNGSQLYLGRGTTRYEGPLTVSTSVSSGGYYTVTLTSPTQAYHNPGEDVVLAQGGTRVIPTGTVVQTGAGPGTQIQYRTTEAATIADGEVTVTNIRVSATNPGTSSRVAAGALTTFSSLPFTGATVTNALPITTGLDTFLDDAYRELIKTKRATRSKGTALAIRDAVRNATSTAENRSVTSSQLLSRQGVSTLYVDDGTGYEETNSGVAFETLVESALGGEQYFSLSFARPASKAFVESTVNGPFALVDDSELSVRVGGVLTTHIFSTSSFSNIAHASGYEVAQSINANPLLGFSARTSGTGSRVVLVAKTDENEDVEVVAASGTDANTVLGFPSSRTYTLYLYKNDRLLTKDGAVAQVSSYTPGAWAAVSSGDTLNLTVDGISVAITVNDVDFVTAGTAYGSVAATNSPESWAAVLNTKIPGVTTTVEDGVLVLTSNRGASSDASVSVVSGTLATAMFGTPSAVGATSDYSLDRNLGQIKLVVPLEAGDRLTAGSLSTRAFYETTAVPSAWATDAEMWWFVDGQSSFVETEVGIGTTLTYVSAAEAWGRRVTITTSTASWGGVQKGDWLVVQDSAVASTLHGAFRIAELPSATEIDIELPAGAAIASTPYVLAEGKVKIVRSATIPQQVTITSGTSFTAASLADLIILNGATAEVYRTTRLRVRTNLFGGDILLASSNTVADTIGLEYVGSGVAHLGSVQSRTDAGTPSFVVTSLTGSGAGYVTPASATGWASDRMLVVTKPFRDSPTTDRSSNLVFATSLAQADAGTPRLYTNNTPTNGWLVPERGYPASPFAFTPDDQLSVLVDQDTTSALYSIPMARTISPPVAAAYGATVSIRDNDTGTPAYWYSRFPNLDLTDYAVWMSARVKTHPATTNAIVWRYNRLGAVGNNVVLAYMYPKAPSTGVAIENSLSLGYQAVTVRLPSGAARAGWSVRSGSKVGICATLAASMYTYTTVFRLATSAATRQVYLPFTAGAGVFAAADVITGGTSGATATVVANVSGVLEITPTAGDFLLGEGLTSGAKTGTVSASAYGKTTVTLTLPGSVTNCGIGVGEVIYLNSSSGSYTSGAKTVTGTSATTITFGDVPTVHTTAASIGSVSLDNSAEVGLSGAGIVVGDIMTLGERNYGSVAPNASAFYGYPTRIASTDSTTYVTTTLPIGPAGGATTTLQWSSVADVSELAFYPIDTGSNGITAIAAAANALDSVVSAVAVGTGGVTTGTLTAASYEASELGPVVQYYSLTDGINWVKTYTPGDATTTNATITFKDAPNANLTGSESDWPNETLKLVPVTASNTSDWLNQPAVSGLFSVGETALTGSGRSLQISTSTVGRDGSVTITGGTANALQAVIQGSPTSTSVGTFSVPVLQSDSIALAGQSWVRLSNSVLAPKNVFTASTALTSITSGTVVVSGTNAWTWANTATGTITTTWQVEQHGDFTCFIDPAAAVTLTGINEGDWVIITSGNSLNRGQFRVVRVSNTTKCFWVENPVAVADVASYTCQFVTYDSVMPGDLLVTESDIWGTTGQWTVTALGATQDTFVVNTAGSAPLADSGAVAALGTSYPLVKMYGGNLDTMIKRIGTVSDTTDASLADVQFDTKGNGWNNLGESFGTVLTALDKLDFDNAIVTGVDAYSQTTGLLAEVNRIVYGDEAQSGTYPGVASAGSRIDISGGQVRRIDIGVAIRMNTSSDVRPQVQSAVASVINASPIGQSIALGKVLSAVLSVGGVTSCVITSPTYALGSDLLQIQPNERPLIFDLSTVTVSIIGD